MSLLAALAKGLGAGTLQNAKAGFDEQTRKKEEIRRQAEIREQISASKDESTREWQKRDEQLNKQIAAGKDELNTRLKFEHDEAGKQRAYELEMFERKLAVATKDAASAGSVRARENHFKSLAETFDALSKRKSEILESDKFATEEQRQAALADIDYIGSVMASDPGTQSLMNEFGGGGYTAYWLAIGDEAAGHDKPQQQGGEPTSGADPQPTSAPGRPGGSGGGAGEDNGQAFTGSYGGSRAANPPLPTAAEALLNHPIEIGPSGYPTNTPQFRGTSLLQMTDQIDSDIGTAKAGANPSGLIRRMQDQGRYGYPGY